jgi:hypothetical protein
MRLAVSWALLTTTLLLSPAAAAQQPPAEAEASGEIVVTGQRTRDEQVRDFVRALTPASSGSIARFQDHVCPLTVGLSPEQNEQVSARLRKIAAAIDLRVSKVGCTPNVLVIATPDKRALLERAAQERTSSFGTMTPRQIRKLARSPGPAAAWQLGAQVDTSGTPYAFDPAIGAYVRRTSQTESRVRTPVARGISASALVVETASLTGLTPVQLADYAAMRLFAEFDPARLPSPPPPTILSILDSPPGTALPITLTHWDFGVLRGLYTGSADRLLVTQRSAIVREVRKQLEKPER